jgi:glycosyltransferase involved in cell wall biosynthesis
MIFDFDDAIWVEDTSSSTQKLKWLKRPSKTPDIIRLADDVIVGNSFLAAYARQFNSNIHIIPTTVDCTVYLPSKSKNSESRICIGWSGSKTTVKHFAPIIPVFKKLKEQYGERIWFKQIGDQDFFVPDLPIESSDWEFHNEVEELNKIDIGIMPLPDDIWSQGKCGFKAIQYLSLEIPAVVSDVGMNSEVVTHGGNGFLVRRDDEWLPYLQQLIEDSSLRMRMGKSGRQHVIEKFSVQACLPLLLNALS